MKSHQGLALRPIPGFTGYFATKCGRIFSARSAGLGRPPRNTWLAQRPHPRTGHARVDLRRDDPDHRSGVKATVQVQRLVAWAWLGDQPVGTEVCHADGRATNNDVENIYYGSPRDNATDREHHAREGLGAREGATSCRDDRGFAYTPSLEWGF